MVPIHIPVKTGKGKSAVPTYPNDFIAEAAASVRTAVAQWVLVPKNTVQISLVGPVIPAFAANTNAETKFPTQENPANGDKTLLNFSPLTTVTMLEYQGLFCALLVLTSY